MPVQTRYGESLTLDEYMPHRAKLVDAGILTDKAAVESVRVWRAKQTAAPPQPSSPPRPPAPPKPLAPPRPKPKPTRPADYKARASGERDDEPEPAAVGDDAVPF
jgi:hypothetical protein